GRRTCPLSPTGAPFEASFSLGPRGAAGTVRYVAVAGTAHPYFTAQLRTQRLVVDEVASSLEPPGAQRWSEHTSGLVQALIPDPSAVPARTRLVTALGVVHDGGDGRLLGLRLYANASLDPAALDRLVARDPAFGEVVGPMRAPGLHPHLAAVEVSAGGAVDRRCYSWSEHGALRCAWPAGRDGAEQALARASIPTAVLDEPAFVCLAAAQGAAPRLTVHLRAQALERVGVSTDDALDGLVRAVDGAAELGRWREAMAATGWPWLTSIVGLSATGDGVTKLNGYVTPEADRRGRQDPTRRP
ncbi:MAG: hypothetical protein M3Y36_10945, partial [Actinomycetota bacterium]|nr:hypothetical protein [Actinomycetota bacterium]